MLRPLLRKGLNMQQAKAKQETLGVVAVAGSYLALCLQGSVSPGDEVQLAALGRSVAGRTSLGFLIESRDFVGWDPAAVAQIIWQHAGTLQEQRRLALVSDDPLQRVMFQVQRPLFSSRERLFETCELARAHTWLAAHASLLGALELPSGSASSFR